jgi:hypothetical protein
MEDLVSKIRDTPLNADQIKRLVGILETKRAELDKQTFEAEKKRLLDQDVPRDWLERAAAEYDRWLAEDYEEGDDKDDNMRETFIDTMEDTTMDLYVRLEQDHVSCKRSNCWYSENPDRVEEHKCNYYHIFNDRKFYCDVCAYDHASRKVDEKAGNHFYPQFEGFMRKRAKLF